MRQRCGDRNGFRSKRVRLAYRQTVVAADIIHGVQTIRTRVNVTDSETTCRVRFGDTQERVLDESGVRQVLMNTHQHTNERVYRQRVIDTSSVLQGVDLIARGERVAETAQGHFLVIVTYGRAEIDGISRAVVQRVFELHHQFLAAHLDIRRVLLRRGHQQVRGYVVQLQILVERDLDPVTMKIDRTHLRFSEQRYRRLRILRPALRSHAPIGTANKQRSKQCYENPFFHLRVQKYNKFCTYANFGGFFNKLSSLGVGGRG